MARDPITNPAADSSGKPSNASEGRIKSVSGGGPAFSAPHDMKSAPPPASPYGKR